MPCRIDPSYYCAEPGCTRPKETGREYCTPCIRLARAVGRHLDDEDGSTVDPTPATVEAEAKPPRCIAYLSTAGDVITLELTGEPKFTEADIERVIWALRNRRKSEFQADRDADLLDDGRACEAAEHEDGE